MAQYSSNLRALYETPVLLSGSPKEIRRERVETVLREVREAGRTLLTEAEAKEILSSYGIPVVEPTIAKKEEEAVELILRKRIDPDFGPIILFGAGGELVEVWSDRAIGLPPLNATQAKSLMERTRIYAALNGDTDRAQADLRALETLLIRSSQFVAEQTLTKLIDVNLLLAY